MASPTSRSLEYCREQEWRAQVVEHWLPKVKRRRDLFGCIDILALDGRTGCLGIQATDGTSVSKRVAKATTECADALSDWLACGNRFEVWGWAKRGPRGEVKRWTLRRVLVALEGGELKSRDADCDY